MLKKLLFGFTLLVIAVGIISTGNAAETGLESQISNESGVKVTVSPQNLSIKAKTWDFKVTLETHTGSLADDLAKSSTLIVDGIRYAPLSWEGAPPGGHHRKGTLRFIVVTPQPPSVELQIHLTEEAAPRRFQWSLKGENHGN